MAVSTLIGPLVSVCVLGAFTLLMSVNTLETEVRLDGSKNSVTTSQRTHRISITKKNWLRPFREIIAVCCKNHAKHTNMLRDKMQGFRRLKQAVGTFTKVFK